VVVYCKQEQYMYIDKDKTHSVKSVKRTDEQEKAETGSALVVYCRRLVKFNTCKLTTTDREVG